ncbi:sensor histidine kinase [Hyalangium gracile]|uniref:sensor histidine kinase n=1 Tax=Hyalangium gracile TaxID=394092 RepID=UPI001CCC5CBF|nr:two-component regulator propeller domain-containing protein [Hyalangium gracile]
MCRISRSPPRERRPPSASTQVHARLLAACLLAGLLATGNAWALEPTKALNQFPHRVWQTEDGLPQSTTVALAQTSDGYLWAGTYEGLVRFDGVRFTVFDPGNTPALPDRSITSLAVDRDGTLWINTNSGLAGMRAGKFFSMPLPEGIIPRGVHQLLPARDGGLWLATARNGLIRLFKGTFDVLTSEHGLASERVLAMAEGEDGSLWVATPEGVQRWDGTAFLPGPEFQGPPTLVTALMLDPQGVLWAGDQAGIVYRQQGAMMLPHPEASLLGSPISVLLMDRHGALWAASRGQGLLRLVNGRRSVLGPESGLGIDSIMSLLEDAEGNLWLGMGSHGLYRLKDAPFTPYGTPEGLGHETVSSLLEARDGSLWFSLLGGGISRLKDGRVTTWTTREGLLDNMVFGSAEGRDGTLWFATRKGLIRWRDGTFSTLPEEGQPPRNPIGYAVVEDEQGTLWTSTQDGLARWDGRQFALVAPKDQVLGGLIRVLKRRAAGGLWVGTQGGGLAAYSQGEIITLSSRGSPISGDVRGLFEDGETLWVGTTQGLFRWKNGDFVRLSREQGLFDDVVFEILPDGKGNLWMTCNKGIFRVSQQELEAVADGRLARVTSRAYGKEDGMRVAECNALGGPSGVRARDGRLWFPTVRGAVAYDARHERAPSLLPPVLLEELRVDGRSVPGAEWSRIPPSAGRVDIQYTAAALAASEQLHFRYKLEGIDPDWVEAGSRRVAYYTRIPPGHHRFLVEAFIPASGVPPRGAQLEFHLQPRFFETILFRVACGLAAVLAVAGAVWLRLRQSRERERKLQVRVDERTAELAMRIQQLEATRERLAHAEKLVAVGTLAAGVGHEINNPLAYILSNLRYLSTELRDLPRREDEKERWQEVEEALADALHGAERVRKIVQALKTLARAQAEPPSRVDLHAVLDRTVEALDQELRRRARLVKDYGLSQPVMGDEGRLGQVFLHLLLNAAQAIPEGQPESNEIRVTTRRDPAGRAIIEVQDTGKGISPEILPRIFEPFFTTKEAGEGTGLGLSICHATIQSMGGEIEVQSEPGQGSIFRILLPPLQVAPAAAP